ncbi:MAG: nucleotide sugar dehydrogenase [Methanosarcinaceae archaeon]
MKTILIGLGYVGLPLAHALSAKYPVIGFDISSEKIALYKQGIDVTNEIGNEALKASTIQFTSNESDISQAEFIIVAVPTPVEKNNLPDLTPLISASEIVGRNMKPGAIIVYESTVFPGVTEDICAPILEKESGLVCGKDFKIGYSPERINPGDKVHTVDKIIKIVAGMDEESTDKIAEVYGSIIPAGIHKAPSIKVAEAAKVIENTQRDINIAFMNELSLIFHRMGIDTKEVLEAAGTKWNFLNFTPGLVGGHCIGVDPYYLTFKAEELGYHPEVILAGRRINDHMGKYVAEQTVKLLISSGKNVNGAQVNILGVTFKENVPDVRNSRVLDIVNELKEYNVHLNISDPYADGKDVESEYGIPLTKFGDLPRTDALILAVPHRDFIQRPLSEILKLFKGGGGVFVDVKHVYSRMDANALGMIYWSL